MAAYLISNVSIKDLAAFQIYRDRAALSIARFGGQYLVRRGDSMPGRRLVSANDHHC
jgi:uncharacterized protein (DUF1330 family)